MPAELIVRSQIFPEEFRAVVDVHLDAKGHRIAGVQTDFIYNGTILGLDSVHSCMEDPSHEKSLQTRISSFFTSIYPNNDEAHSFVRGRSILLSIDDLSPFPDEGILYSCEFDFVDALTIPFNLEHPVAASPYGDRVPIEVVHLDPVISPDALLCPSICNDSSCTDTTTDGGSSGCHIDLSKSGDPLAPISLLIMASLAFASAHYTRQRGRRSSRN